MTTYSSTLRQEQATETRRRIARAALRLFAERGYARTSVADVAGEAGVAVQTIYGTFGSKRRIVLSMVDVIDDLAGLWPLLERLDASDDPREIVRLHGAICRCFRQGEAGEIVRVLLAAAGSEPELAVAAAEGRRRHRLGAGHAAGRLEHLGALRSGVSRERATAVMSTLTSQETYTQLADEHGWTLDECERWIRETVERLVLAPRRKRA
ncbi:MAG: TetR/AcrR family transcriptional regulator [Gaiellaceae bacterium]